MMLDAAEEVRELAGDAQVTALLVVDPLLLNNEVKDPAKTTHKVIVATRNGFIRMYEYANNHFRLKHQHFIANTTLTAMCQIKCIQRRQTGTAAFYPGENIAVASSFNDIYLYNFMIGVVIFSFAGHDDYITGMHFAGDQLVSYSLDMTLKVWDLDRPLTTNAKDILDQVITIYDHCD